MDQIKIDIADNSALAEPLADTRLLKRTVAHVLIHFQINQAVVSVAIVDDAAMKSINKQYLKKTESTDVISFDLSSKTDDQSNTQLDCEVVINAERAMIVAKANDRSAEGELHLYLIHGLLHHLDYNDKTQELADPMHRKEDELLSELGFGCVYKLKR